MVQALSKIITRSDYDEASLKEALSLFVPYHNDAAAADTLSFLCNDAIPYERSGETRTYLMINDAAWNRGELQIDGYFSLALKVIYFRDGEIANTAFGDPAKKNCPAYLIGQLARGEHTNNGDGAFFLDTALSYIATAHDLVGGRLVYLDCAPCMCAYYEKHGFSFLQDKKKSDLVQMYRVI